MNSLSKPYNGEYGSYINPHGLTICDTATYQVATDEKLTYYRTRCVDKDAIHCVIPMIGSAPLNTSYWRSMKRAFERERVKLLVSMGDRQKILQDNGEYYKMSATALANAVAPYGQTDLLLSESVNLRTEIKNDQIKLEAPRGGHRDRAVTCAMGMLVFDMIENEWLKQAQDDDDEDYENIQLVF